ncbi:Serine protease Do-like HtrA [Acaryochloris thomasi RCC1774]|uniref:Serine protease Do-like HtrA n=1 Tax=Acaryochloris thomasi RCC1774 TaxID=1764569 RepID=A0A2W1JK15_9CYAN|nr:serine protease [Acaryochloris thomasi]PZD73729.1 Serine protease Do-like HtrA [Acaryochloris thomasi RCC1774]
MNRSSLLLSGLLGTTTALVWICPQATALSSRAISQIAKGTTVRIISQTAGSGVLIKQEGNTYTVLTAAHVVASADDYEVITPDGSRAQPTTIKKLPEVDLALVQFTSNQTHSVVELGDSGQVSEGSLSYVSGFPLRTEAISETIYNFTEGKITANAGRALQDGYALVYSNNTLPGMSGGPVLNEQGKLIGIHGRADTTERVQDQSLNPDIYIKSGFNLGIPTRTFLQLAPKTGLNLGFATPTQQTASQTTADDYFLQAQAQIDREEYEDAIATLTQAIDLNPDYSAAYAQRGFAQARLAKASAALADSEQAIRLDPQNFRAYLVRGLVRSRIGETQEALADAEKGVSLQPNFAGSYGLRGTLRLLLEDYSGAVTDLKKTAELMRSQGNTAQAESIEQGITVFSKLQQGKGTFNHYLARAAVRIQLKDIQGAASDFQDAAALAQQQRQLPQYLIAKSMLRITDASIARRYATQDDPQTTFPNAEGMLVQLNQALRNDPNDGNSYRFRGTLLAELFNRPQQALADIQKAAAYFQDQKDTTNYQLMTSYIEALK